MKKTALHVMEVSPDGARVVRANIDDITAHHIARFLPAFHTVGDAIKAAGFDCYVQGLIDGTRVAIDRPAMIDELRAKHGELPAQGKEK